MENEFTKKFEGIYYSRFVVSWYKVSKVHFDRYKFMNWLRSLTINDKKIPEAVINDIVWVAECGKLELEDSAYEFLNKKEV